MLSWAALGLSSTRERARARVREAARAACHRQVMLMEGRAACVDEAVETLTRTVAEVVGSRPEWVLRMYVDRVSRFLAASFRHVSIWKCSSQMDKEAVVRDIVDGVAFDLHELSVIVLRADPDRPSIAPPEGLVERIVARAGDGDPTARARVVRRVLGVWEVFFFDLAMDFCAALREALEMPVYERALGAWPGDADVLRACTREVVACVTASTEELAHLLNEVTNHPV